MHSINPKMQEQDSSEITRAKIITRPAVGFSLIEHCNLGCYHCDQASPLLPKKFASVDQFSHDFEALARVFHSRQLRIVGGEPLLHPQLSLFLAAARRVRIADSIVLITNGVLLHRAPIELWELIDQLWISVYPGVSRKLPVEECVRICEAHNVRLDINPMTEFTQTLTNTRIEDSELTRVIYRECRNANDYSCHTVHEGRFYRCSIAPIMSQRLALRGLKFDNNRIDGVALHDNSNLYEDLDACLKSRTPLAACSYCFGTSGPAVAHRQLNRQGRSMWVQEDHTADIQAVKRRLLGPAESRVLRSLARLRRSLRSVPILRSTYHLALQLRHALRETKECGQEFFADFCVREDNVSESGDPHRQQLAHQLVLLDRISRGGPFLDCLAIGCAEDLNIEALGACCESLLVADFSPMALESARQRRQWPGRTAFAGFDLRRDPIPGTFDLIVVVGVLDYFSRPSTFWRIRQKLAAALRPGAHLMIETVRSDDPLLDNFWWNKVMIKGKWINPYIAQHPALTTVEAVETAGYTITVYRKVLAS